jgi:trimeric autotransporter adhesin
MSSFKSKLRLISAFAALATLALAVSCRGFFVSPTLTSVAIGPTTVSLSPTQTYQMTATGTFNDGSQRNVTSQSIWSSSDGAVASIGQNSGLVTAAPTATTIGSTTISASDGAITATTTATVNVCPQVSAMTLTAPQGTSGHEGDTLEIDAKATVGSAAGTDVTQFVTWNIGDSTVLTISNGTVLLGSAPDAATTTVSATLCNVNSTNSLTFTISNFTGN